MTQGWFKINLKLDETDQFRFLLWSKTIFYFLKKEEMIFFFIFNLKWNSWSMLKENKPKVWKNWLNRQNNMKRFISFGKIPFENFFLRKTSNKMILEIITFRNRVYNFLIFRNLPGIKNEKNLKIASARINNQPIRMVLFTKRIFFQKGTSNFIFSILRNFPYNYSKLFSVRNPKKNLILVTIISNILIFFDNRKLHFLFLENLDLGTLFLELNRCFFLSFDSASDVCYDTIHSGKRENIIISTSNKILTFRFLFVKNSKKIWISWAAVHNFPLNYSIKFVGWLDHKTERALSCDNFGVILVWNNLLTPILKICFYPLLISDLIVLKESSEVIFLEKRIEINKNKNFSRKKLKTLMRIFEVDKKNPSKKQTNVINFFGKLEMTANINKLKTVFSSLDEKITFLTKKYQGKKLKDYFLLFLSEKIRYSSYDFGNRFIYNKRNLFTDSKISGVISVPHSTSKPLEFLSLLGLKRFLTKKEIRLILNLKTHNEFGDNFLFCSLCRRVLKFKKKLKSRSYFCLAGHCISVHKSLEYGKKKTIKMETSTSLGYLKYGSVWSKNQGGHLKMSKELFHWF